MIGFFNTAEGFSLSAIQALQAEADDTYVSTGTPVTPSEPLNLSIGPGETVTVSNLSFADTGSTQAISALGTRYEGSTLIIENCKFVNMDWAIYINEVDNVIVRSCYIEDVGAGIKINRAIDLQVIYNKIKNYGTRTPSDTDWAGNAIQCTFSSSLTRFEILGNLLDRSSDNRENLCENTFVEDHISCHKAGMTGSGENIGHIKNNMVVGAAVNCESIGGGGITLDQQVDWVEIDGNYVYNAGGFAIGIASSKDSKMLNNMSFYSIEHDDNLRNNARNECLEGPGWNNGPVITNWNDGEVYDCERLIFTGNRITAKRAEDPDRYYHWMEIDLSEITASNNSFIINQTGGTETDGLPMMTEAEMRELLFGPADNEKTLFEMHGTGEEYFDENL